MPALACIHRAGTPRNCCICIDVGITWDEIFTTTLDSLSLICGVADTTMVDFLPKTVPNDASSCSCRHKRYGAGAIVCDLGKNSLKLSTSSKVTSGEHKQGVHS